MPRPCYIASSAAEPGGGIYLVNLPEASAAGPPRHVASPGKVLFVRHVSRDLLLASHDIANSDGRPSGHLSCFRIEPDSGNLSLVSTRATGGTTPCFIDMAGEDSFALVSHFRGPGDLGSLSALPIRASGEIGEPTDQIFHEGSSTHPTRQKCSHIHCAISPTGCRDVYAADLGTDRVHHYRLDTSGKFRVVESVATPVQSGPRHLALHPSGHWLYLITEIGNTALVFERASASGKIEMVQEISALPEHFSDGSAAADLHLTQDGAFLVGSNRGHNSLAVFAVDPDNGTLCSAGHFPCGGDNPRGFLLSPKVCLVANQSDDKVTVFDINRTEALEIEEMFAINIPQPVSLATWEHGA